jgi:hypothetical protein
MTKKVRMHVTLTAKLISGLAEYKEVECCSQAQAGQNLMALGLQVWEQSRLKSGRSYMIDMIENILQTTYEIKVQQQLFAVKAVEKKADPHGLPYSLEYIQRMATEHATQKMQSLQPTTKKKN